MANISDTEQFIIDVSPFAGENLEILLYSVRSPDAPCFTAPDLCGWPGGTNVSNFYLYDEDWPPREGWPILVELFTIKTPYLVEPFEEFLVLAMMSFIKQGATVSWCMFEGAFGGIQPLFTPWIAQNSYGIAIAGRSPKLAISAYSRNQGTWLHEFELALEYVNDQHPKLRGFLPPPTNTSHSNI